MDMASNIAHKKWTFVVMFTFVFFISYVGLTYLGITPFAPVDIAQVPQQNPPSAVQEEGELPTEVSIPSIGIETDVSNPSTTDIPSLDRALLSGAVRYPGSGALGENGNVLLFGHSSHLPIVHNQAYKAFNDIQNLKEGDSIFVKGETKVYEYAVEKVEKANTTTGAIPLDVSGQKITLATCDNFGSKADRFIVTARFVSSKSL